MCLNLNLWFQSKIQTDNNFHFNSLYILAQIYESCPFMDIMPQVSDPSEWDIEDLLKSLRCDTCLDEIFNNWLVCLRRFSMLNLHPEYVSRSRQYWFVAMLPLKFLILPQEYANFLFSFNGLLLPKMRTRTLSDPQLPKKKRTANFITYGKHLLCNVLLREDHL